MESNGKRDGYELEAVKTFKRVVAGLVSVRRVRLLERRGLAQRKTLPRRSIVCGAVAMREYNPRHPAAIYAASVGIRRLTGVLYGTVRHST